ncbi:hypothetical protein PINS_up022976 [Pythium insidiosum]|nr:hypothetical protein PINS_up022976 [Pythium insidiosum]
MTEMAATPKMTALAALDEAYSEHMASFSEAKESFMDGASMRVAVVGRFVRKRKLSKGLIFGDVMLDGGELLEVMIRAHEGLLTVEAIRQINWDVHLGDVVTIDGLLTRKENGHLMLTLLGVTVEELWSESHPGENFDHARFGTATIHSLQAEDRRPRGSVTLEPSSQAKKPTKYTNIVQINGFNACKYYFSGANGVNCLRGAQCHFWHGAPEDYETNRRLWLQKRQDQRRAVSQIEGDEHAPETKWLKAQRARLFCDWLVSQVEDERLRSGSGVIDVAGGKGEIPIFLWNQRGIPTTLIDPRPMKINKKLRQLTTKDDAGEAIASRGLCPQLLCYLTEETVEEHRELFENASILLGMHPDEATEAIVDIALRLQKPFAVVPCCVMSRLFPNRRCLDGTEVATYEALVQYLKEKDPRIQSSFLSFTGRNQVLYLFDYDQ